MEVTSVTSPSVLIPTKEISITKTPPKSSTLQSPTVSSSSLVPSTSTSPHPQVHTDNDVEEAFNKMWNLLQGRKDLADPSKLLALREEMGKTMLSSLRKDSIASTNNQGGISTRTRSRGKSVSASDISPTTTISSATSILPKSASVSTTLPSQALSTASSNTTTTNRKRRRTNDRDSIDEPPTVNSRPRLDSDTSSATTTPSTSNNDPFSPIGIPTNTDPTSSSSYQGKLRAEDADAGGEVSGRNDHETDFNPSATHLHYEDDDEEPHPSTSLRTNHLVLAQRVAKIESLLDDTVHKLRNSITNNTATTTALIATPPPTIASENFIKINVGGTVFTTRKSTLSRFEGTFLSAITSGRFKDEFDEHGNVFIDRDPKHFQFILNWLRDPTAPTEWPTHDPSLLHELDYFGLTGAVYKGAIYVAYGFDGAARLASIECYSPLVKKWTKIAEFNCELSSPACAPMGGKMYITGGKNAKNHAVGTVAYFDPYDKQIHITADLQIARFGHGLVELNDHIYAVGGYGDDGSRVHMVEKYNDETKLWTDVPRLLKKRSALGCDALKGKIYVAGGYGPGSGNTLADTVEAYCPKLNTWKLVSPLKTPRAHVCCIAFEGKLWAIGGYDGNHASQKVEVYDPEKNEWTDGPPLIRKRSVVVCAVLDNQLYAIGGYDGQHYLSSSEVYSPEINRWISGPEMLTPRGRHCVCTLPI